MVDVKVRAGVVVTGKVVAVDKDKAVVDVTIVWVIGLLDVDVVVVVITNAELDISKVVCSCSVLGLAVLSRSVEIVDLGTVECLVLVLGLIEVEVVSEVETVEL